MKFKTIHDELYPVVFNYLLKITNNNISLSSILTNETMVKVWYRVDEFDGIHAKLSTWAITIAKNKFIDYQRYLNRKNRKSCNVNYDDVNINESYFFVSNDTPYNKLVDNEFRELVIDNINKLPENYKDILYDIIINEYSNNEVSEMHGLNVSTVKARLNRGRKKLKSMINNIN